MVQLISVMYKDQQASTLQKLLDVWLEDALSDSSDDFESNTTPPQNENSGVSSPIATPDPTTSESSDNGGKISTKSTTSFIFQKSFVVCHSGGNGNNIDKSIERRRSQANVKNVEAALHLQSRKGIKQSENTDEFVRLQPTEDGGANDDAEKTRASDQVILV